MSLTLEEQRNNLKNFVTNGPQQFNTKRAIFATLNTLIDLRLEIEKGPTGYNEDRVAELLAAALGDSPTLKR